MINPYWGKQFFGVFIEFIMRLPLLFRGSALATDELQIIVLSLVAVSCALLGVFIVLRKETMLANSVSHTILLGIVLSYLLFMRGGKLFPFDLKIHVLMVAALVAALFTTFLSGFFTKFLKLQKDASIGLVFTSLFSLGILLVTLFTRSAHVGIEVVIGNVDMLQMSDLKQSLFLFFFNLFFILLFFRGYLITSFDLSLAKSLNIPTTFFHYFLMFQLSATIVGAFRSVGVILVLSYLVTPCLIARCYTNRIKKILVMAPLIGIVTSIIGVALSRHLFSKYHLALSTGALCVVLLALFYCASLCILSFKKAKRIA